MVFFLYLPYSVPKECPWLEGATNSGVSPFAPLANGLSLPSRSCCGYCCGPRCWACSASDLLPGWAW